ncbi:uncharacterized protein [Euwallacea fornicatus]|uniref:uncharacterized protein n=1 Tax=Euwallacea fornicatus TaxID=995702 RepID=UPI00338F97BC
MTIVSGDQNSKNYENYENCENNLVQCLIVRAVTLMNDSSAHIADNITNSPMSLNENDEELITEIFVNNSGQQIYLDSAQLDNIFNYLKTHYVIPNLLNLSELVLSEERAQGKKKKKEDREKIMFAMSLISGVIGLITVKAITLIIISLVAGKALLAAIIAFTLTSVMAMRTWKKSEYYGKH